jgi:hypothetical protein
MAMAGGGHGMPPGICSCCPAGIKGSWVPSGKGKPDGDISSRVVLMAIGWETRSSGIEEGPVPGVEGGIEASVVAETMVSAFDEDRVCMTFFPVAVAEDAPATGNIGNWNGVGGIFRKPGGIIGLDVITDAGADFGLPFPFENSEANI